MYQLQIKSADKIQIPTLCMNFYGINLLILTITALGYTLRWKYFWWLKYFSRNFVCYCTRSHFVTLC